MWHWLRKKVYAIDYVILLSIGIACSIHAFLFLCFFIMCWASRMTVVQINRQLVGVRTPIIIIDPHARMVGLKQCSAATTTQNNHPASTLVPVTQSLIKKNSATVSVEKKVQKTVSKKLPEKKKAVDKKKIIKKTPVKKIESKKDSVKPVVVKKKHESIPKKQKPEIIKKIASTPEPEPVPAVSKKIETVPVIAETEKSAVENVHQSELLSCEGPILIARSAQEAAVFTLHVQIQEELLRVWHPPVGIEEALSCQMRVILDATGVVQQIDMVKQSGKLLFDVSARAAIQQAVWPHGVWGTTMELELR